jgi:geranylgeranyl diphosphate synthase type II
MAFPTGTGIDPVSRSLMAALAPRRQLLEHFLRTTMMQADVPLRLRQAMAYSVLDGGKRMRPLLAFAAAEAVGGHWEAALVPAAAVELVHAYSLIHDDLPAMDDDVLRRGKPTCHVAFDEATAILAGDALQALAFELLAASPRLSSGHATRLAMLSELARASGRQGMVGGQAIDIAAAGTLLDEAALSRMHGMKTGALIEAAVVMGALASNLAGEARLAQLRRFARLAGLAFQVRDDILDVEVETSESGKEQGKDARLGKPTYTSMLGLEGARERLAALCSEALDALAPFGAPAEGLRGLMRLIVERRA